jgi:hypothetical protein
MKYSPSLMQIGAALVAAQPDLLSPERDGTVDTGKFKFRYTTLAEVMSCVRPALNRHGISVLQSVGTGQRGPTVTTLLLHTSGEWIETEPLEMPAGQADAKAWGSAITYAKRYSLLASVAVVADMDDDAGAACVPPKPAQQAPARQPQQQPAAQQKAPAPSGSGVTPAPAKPAQQQPAKKPRPMPKNKDELDKLDASAAATGKWKVGELKRFLIGRFGDNLLRWENDPFQQAIADFCAPAPKEVKKEASADDDPPPPVGHHDEMLAWLERLDDQCAHNGYGKRGFFMRWMEDRLGPTFADWDASDIASAIEEFKTARTHA